MKPTEEYFLTLPCGASIELLEVRTIEEAKKDGNGTWLPFVEVQIKGEIEYQGSDTDDAAMINIAIQHRSIDPLIEALQHLKQEMEK
jgi:hypothetical protein